MGAVVKFYRVVKFSARWPMMDSGRGKFWVKGVRIMKSYPGVIKKHH